VKIGANAGHIPSWGESCGCYVLSPVADACRWVLLLLSSLPGSGCLAVARVCAWRDVHPCPGAVTTRTVQGMARVRSGQAPAWPLSSDRSVRRGSRVKRDFACAFTRHFPLVLVALRSQSRLMLEGRTRTLSGPSPDLSSAGTLAPSALPLPVLPVQDSWMQTEPYPSWDYFPRNARPVCYQRVRG
jgi:hypothetical protein